jgi:flagellar basal body rod protein FlgG
MTKRTSPTKDWIMVYDIINVAAAMKRKIIQMDHTANNLANASTPGFKAEHLRAMRDFGAGGEIPAETIVDFTRGATEMTGNPLDLDIEGDGFFAVQAKEGLAFTRRGNFKIDRENRLVTQDGLPAMGDGGPITLGPGKIDIGRDGSVMVDQNVVGKLRIVDFDNRTALTRTGEGLYRDPGGAGMKQASRVDISSGYIERSNVNVIREMMDLIEVNRSFEYYQKIIHALTEMDKMSVGRVGRLA